MMSETEADSAHDVASRRGRPAARHWWREPLLHFVLIGVVTFALYTHVASPAADDDRLIVVDREALLTYLQYRLRHFGDDQAQRQLDAMSAVEFKRLVDDYVREEVLYRQALALGMDQNDDVIRQRLIQKISFVNRSMVSESVAPTEVDIEQYYQTHSSRYREPALVTFSHIFFSDRLAGRAAALMRARQVQQQCNRGRVPFDEGARHGDRFLYHVNYVQSRQDVLASHFGESMAKALLGLSPDDQRWQGPFESTHGVHLVMLVGNAPERQLSLQEVRGRIRERLEQERMEQRERDIINDVIKAYTVKVLAGSTSPES